MLPNRDPAFRKSCSNADLQLWERALQTGSRLPVRMLIDGRVRPRGEGKGPPGEARETRRDTIPPPEGRWDAGTTRWVSVESRDRPTLSGRRARLRPPFA